jgi:6-phosphogluconate dehydrogenase
VKVGIIGLGKMGLSIANRLIEEHEVLGFDTDSVASMALKNLGGQPVELFAISSCPIIWLMLPAETVDAVLTAIAPKLHEKTIIVDGGNSHFSDSIRRADEFGKKNIFFLDSGTSGGLHGRDIGFSLTIGGDQKAYATIEPLLKSIAASDGYAYMGPSGSGHYVKMVHNGIEYALLQAYANGFDLLKHGHYKNLNVEKIAQTWNNGAIIRSWILTLLKNVLAMDVDKFSGAIDENLTGQWALGEAKKQNVDMPLLEKALAVRAWSRKTGGNYATKLIALLRNAFGGHPIKHN